MPPWQKMAWLSLLGAGGTVARYALDGVVQNWCGTRFPWGILAVNALGCLLFGVCWSMAEDRALISGETRFLILTGCMGAFTTFSTFTFQTSEFLRDSQWLLAAANVAAQVGLGLVCLIVGLALGRLI